MDKTFSLACRMDDEVFSARRLEEYSRNFLLAKDSFDMQMFKY
jgi:hypothetical protein